MSIVTAVRQALFRPRMALVLAAAFATGLGLPYALKICLPSGTALPYTAIAASMVIDLLALALLLAWMTPTTPLPDGRGSECQSRAREQAVPQPWPRCIAWLGSTLVAGAAFAGLALAGTHGEAARTFLLLWVLFAAQAAALAGLHTLLSLIFFGLPRAPAMVCLLALGLATTALFWSREPIQALSRQGSANTSMALADGVLKLSPPLAVACAWHQESDAARAPRSAAQGRFDIIRAPLTYEVWIGSYQALPYPQVLPAVSETAPFKPGLILALLAWGLPLLILGDILHNRCPS